MEGICSDSALLNSESFEHHHDVLDSDHAYSISGLPNSSQSYFDNFDDVLSAIHEYQIQTGTKYFSHKRPRSLGGEFDFNKHAILFEGVRSTKSIYSDSQLPFTGVPFMILGCAEFDCTYGVDYNKRRKAMRIKELSKVGQGIRKRKSRKMDCKSKIYIRDVVFFSDFKIAINTEKRRRLCVEKIKKSFSINSLNYDRKFIVRFPKLDSHTGHLIGETPKSPEKSILNGVAKRLKQHYPLESYTVPECDGTIVTIPACSDDATSQPDDGDLDDEHLLSVCLPSHAVSETEDLKSEQPTIDANALGVLCQQMVSGLSGPDVNPDLAKRIQDLWGCLPGNSQEHVMIPGNCQFLMSPQQVTDSFYKQLPTNLMMEDLNCQTVQLMIGKSVACLADALDKLMDIPPNENLNEALPSINQLLIQAIAVLGNANTFTLHCRKDKMSRSVPTVLTTLSL